MSTFSAILDLIEEISKKNYFSYKDGNLDWEQIGKNSIARKAQPAILQFPVLTSNTISIQDLTMVNKALEREYCTFVRLAMGLDDLVDMEDVNSKEKYIKKFHQNIGTKTGSSINLKQINRILSDSVENLNKENLKVYCESEITGGLKLDKLNDKTNKRNNNYYFLKNEDQMTYPTTVNLSTGEISSQNSKEEGSIEKSSQQRVSETNKKSSQQRVPETIEKRSQQRVSETIKKGFQQRVFEKRYDSPYKNQLLDNQVNKANELIPTTLDIYVTFKDKNGEFFSTNILLGVKTITHLIPSEEMVYNISTGLEEKRAFFRFIQWTTGEIRFFKDYLLCLDRIKKEAVSQRSNSHWWRSLKARSKISKLRAATFSKGQLLPNATILISMDEVEYMANNYGINLFSSIKSVRTLMDIFFLLGLVIVDPGSELVHFFFDGQSSYQTFSYSSLERENRNMGNDVKAIVSLMSKMR
jgi:hypothetical protein